MKARPIAAEAALPEPIAPEFSDDQPQEAAIAWMVELRSGDSTQETRQAFERWLMAHPSHKMAWDKLGGAVAHTLGGFPAQAMPAPGLRASTLETSLRRAGQRAAGRRRVLRAGLAIGGVGAGLGWLVPRLGLQLGLMPDVYADLSTGTAQRRQVTLPDGSQMLLDARSSVDLDFSSERRLVRLRQGQLIVSVQPGQAAPFIVQTAQGQAQALGTRYLVRQLENQTQVDVLEHRVAVSAYQGQTQVLEAGQGVRFNDEGEWVWQAVPPERSDAWARGLFIADDQPLSDLVEALRPYHAGLIRLAPKAAALRLTGRYALDDVPATLAALADTLPLAIQQRAAGWIIQIDTRN